MFEHSWMVLGGLYLLEGVLLFHQTDQHQHRQERTESTEVFLLLIKGSMKHNKNVIQKFETKLYKLPNL